MCTDCPVPQTRPEAEDPRVLTNVYLIISSIIFPILALCWICCIACCIYRGLAASLGKKGRTTRVQVLVRDRDEQPIQRASGRSRAESQPRAVTAAAARARAATAAASSRTVPGVMPDVETTEGLFEVTQLSGGYAPAIIVPPNLRSAMVTQNKGLGDSLGPIYYPKYPQNHIGAGADEAQTPTRKKFSPMTPLQAPWPHLPPINKQSSGPTGAGQRVAIPTEIRSFLENQN